MSLNRKRHAVHPETMHEDDGFKRIGVHGDPKKRGELNFIGMLKPKFPGWVSFFVFGGACDGPTRPSSSAILPSVTQPEVLVVKGIIMRKTLILLSILFGFIAGCASPGMSGTTESPQADVYGGANSTSGEAGGNTPAE